MSLNSSLVALAIVISELLADINVPSSDEDNIRPRRGLEELGLAVAVELRVIEEASEPISLGGRVYAHLLGLVLEEVHVAADACVLRVRLFALLSQRVRDHLARVLAYKVTAAE